MALEEVRARVMANARGPVRDPLPGEIRTLTLLDRRGDPTAAPRPVTVVVSAACPVCGKARGEAKLMTIVDIWTGTEHTISRWRNSCSHVDLHADVIEEAERGNLVRSA